MAGYNRSRAVEHLLEKTDSSPPSFTVHLHSECWILNNGSKFLYNNQIASLLDDIRAHRIPVDYLELFDSARVPFYEGCMIVELLDYRPHGIQEPALKVPQKTRVVLHPNPETQWADLCLLNQRHGNKWTDQDALEVEAKLLLSTSEPLCLDPDPHLTRIVNHILRVSTPSTPIPLKRKLATAEPEEDGPEKVKRERLLTFMAPRENKSHTPSYRMLDYFQNHKSNPNQGAPPIAAGNQFLLNSQSQSSPNTTPTPALQADSPANMSEGKGHKKQKINNPPVASYGLAFVPANGSHTPVPPQPTHQFVNQHPPTVASPGIQPQVYPNVQASTEAAQRSATPAQSQPNQAQIQQQPQQQQQYMHYQQPQQQPQQIQQQPSHQPHPTQPLSQSQQPPNQHVQQRPPSQPRQTHPQPHQHVQQITQQHQAVQQQPHVPRFTQSPKPQQNAMSPPRTQPTPQPYPSVTPQFQPHIPNAHFLQQPPNPRQAQKTHINNGTPTQQQVAGPSQQNNGQLYVQQLQQSQQQLQQQQQQQQQNAQALMQQQQQRTNVAISNTQKNGGRATPQIQMQMNQGQSQQQPHPRPPSVAATPSPARGSPIVLPQQLSAGPSSRMSPMTGKAQLSQQGQTQQPQGPQPHHLASQSVLMQSARPTGTPQLNAAQIRTMNHGSPQQSHMPPPNNIPATANGTPIMATASPRMNGRPLTPAMGADGKPQMGQMMMPGQTPIIRRPTPLQQATQQQQQQQILGMPVGSPPMQQAAQLHQGLTPAQVQASHAAQAARAQVHVQAQAQAQAQSQALAQQQVHIQPANHQQPHLQVPPQGLNNSAQMNVQINQQMNQQALNNNVQMNPQMNQQMAAQYALYNNYQNFNQMNPYWRQAGGMNAIQNLTPQQQQQAFQIMQQQQQQQQLQGGASGSQGMMMNGQNTQLTQQQLAMLATQKAMHAQRMNLTMGAGPGAVLQQQSMAGKVTPQQMAHIAQMSQYQAQQQAQLAAKGKMGTGQVAKKGPATAKKGPPR